MNHTISKPTSRSWCNVCFYIWITLTFSCTDKLPEGEQIEKEYTPNEFIFLEIHRKANFHPMQVNLIQDTIDLVELSGLREALEKITVEGGDTLFIYDNNSTSFFNREKPIIHINIHFKSSNYLSIWMNGNMKLFATDTIRLPKLQLSITNNQDEVKWDIRCNQLTVSVYDRSSSSINISGQAQLAQLYLKGVGIYDFGELATHNITLKFMGTGFCTVQASDTLIVGIHNVGDVYYKGAPQSIQYQAYDVGQLIKLDK